MRLWMFDIKNWEGIEPAKQAFSERLADFGYDSTWTATLPTVFDDDDLILCHTPLRGWRDVTHLPVLGLRLLDRRQRLVVLDRAGVPTAPWASPTTWDGVQELFERWDTPNLLFKADTSFRRQGVRVVRRQDEPFSWLPGDVFMRIVDGAPDTYKVEIFGDRALVARRLGTRSVFDPEFVSARSEQELIEMDDEMRDAAATAGAALLPLGTGYMSVDMMRDQGRWVIIEANTCSIGRKTTWGRWPKQYGIPYADSVAAWLERGDRVPLALSIARTQSLEASSS